MVAFIWPALVIQIVKQLKRSRLISSINIYIDMEELVKDVLNASFPWRQRKEHIIARMFNAAVLDGIDSNWMRYNEELAVRKNKRSSWLEQIKFIFCQKDNII